MVFERNRDRLEDRRCSTVQRWQIVALINLNPFEGKQNKDRRKLFIGVYMKNNRDVIIVGAGIIGCAIAFQLTRKGYRTISIDKNADVGSGSTINSCAIVRFSYSTLEGVTLAYEGYHYWKDWTSFLGVEDERGYVKYNQCGHLVLKTKSNDRQGMLNLYRTVGVKFEEWNVEKIKEKLPIFNLNSFAPPRPVDDPSFSAEPTAELAGAIYAPEAGYINDPQLAAHNLRCAVEALGGEFKLRRSVVAINQEDSHVTGVTLDGGQTINAEIVVNAAGPHSFVINHLAGVDKEMLIKTRALRREVHHLPSPQDFDFENNGIVTSDTNLGVYVRPEIGNKITVGSTDPACDPKTWVDDPDEFDATITQSQWDTQVFRLAKRIPDLPIPNMSQGVVDLYDVADDWIPIYDKSDLDGFYMAVGTSGHQFKNAGAVGALMADLIDATESGNDHDNNPVQHKCRYTGKIINTGSFSRLRKIKKEGSFSVRG